MEGSKLGHKICGRSANKYILFYIHQGLPCSYAASAWQMQIKNFLIDLMASRLVTHYEKMLYWVHKAFLDYWQSLEYIWGCCLPNLMSQSGNSSCGVKQLYRQHCVKSSYKEPILVQYNTVWLFLSGFWKSKNWSHILETSLEDPPMCLGIYKCIPLECGRLC